MLRHQKLSHLSSQGGAQVPGAFPAAHVPDGYRHPHDKVEMWVWYGGGVGGGGVQGAHFYETPTSGARTPEADDAINIHTVWLIN